MLKTSLTSLAVIAASASVSLPLMACDALRAGPRGVVSEVVDGDTVLLDNGIVVRMIGTQAPKLPLGREGFETWPMAEESRLALKDLVLGKPVRLGYGGQEVDRYERALAHLFVLPQDDDAEEVWAQHWMVAQGFARVYSFPDNRKCLTELQAAESSARARGLGLWADPHYRVRSAEKPGEVLERTGHYELVEGRVLSAGAAGGRVYLNFGRNWREDFTIVIEPPAQRLFAADGLDPLVLEDRLIRVRGWVDEWDGPRIEVTHPEQIEVIGAR